MNFLYSFLNLNQNYRIDFTLSTFHSLYLQLQTSGIDFFLFFRPGLEFLYPDLN